MIALLGVLLLSAVLWTTASGAASTSISEPSGTYHVVLDATGKALPVTVVAKGFKPGSQVFVEACNGRTPSDPNWSPTLDCDSGTATAPAIADSTGTARFSKTDRNRMFTPVVGASPSKLFNCIAPHSTPPSDDLTSYTTCQIRVASNNVLPTDDQVFRAVVIGSGGSSGSGAAGVIFVIVMVLVLAGIAVGVVLWVRRRRTASAPAK